MFDVSLYGLFKSSHTRDRIPQRLGYKVMVFSDFYIYTYIGFFVVLFFFDHLMLVLERKL